MYFFPLEVLVYNYYIYIAWEYVKRKQISVYT
jgi:hypothetical protein